MRENGLRARPWRRGWPDDTGERATLSDNLLDRTFAAPACPARAAACRVGLMLFFSHSS
jgi:transposase InsO family protein